MQNLVKAGEEAKSQGKRFFPVEYLKKDNTINLAAGRIGKEWTPLEVGNVYPG